MNGTKDDILVLDYGLGNSSSVLNMLRHIGAPARLSSCPDDIRASRKLILPGVGHFDAGARALERFGLASAIKEAALSNGANVLGICLGMQMLFSKSEEGQEPGLNLISGRVIRFRAEPLGLRVPHMGWNTVAPLRRDSIFSGVDQEQRFYFVHSYHAVCDRSEDVIGTTKYGVTFAAAVQRENIVGVQFHPEKSHRYGMALLARFAGLKP